MLYNCMFFLQKEKNGGSSIRYYKRMQNKGGRRGQTIAWKALTWEYFLQSTQRLAHIPALAIVELISMQEGRKPEV